MKCKDCCYFWQDKGEDYPWCHYVWNDGYAPCEVEEYEKETEDYE